MIAYICKGGNWDDNLGNLGWDIGMIILEIGITSCELAWISEKFLNEIWEIGIGKWDDNLGNWDNQEFDFPPLHPNA